jgi:nitrogen-specific signal transduction histidine kinase
VGSIIQDISERKRLELQLQQSQRMESVGRLAGGIAHDFNNLLTTIMGSVSLARLDRAADDALQETLGEIESAAESASNLTRQLLTLGLRQVTRPRVLDLNELIDRTQRMLVRLIGEDIDLQTQVSERPCHIKADPGQIEQVLVNLAVNARDAMPTGGRLRIETTAVAIDSAQRHGPLVPDRFILMSVTDDGLGMDDETRVRVFDPFFTTKAEGEGTGLGLSTVYGIVKQHSGHIEVASTPGAGTAFRVYFPAAQGEPAPLIISEASAAPPQGNETILVVEDEEIVRAVAVRILERLGYRVLQASSSAEALAVVEEHGGDLDLLMTDVVMPQMDGRELADRLHRVLPELKVLYSSGYAENVIAHHGVLDHDVNFIAKPYRPQALAEKVREVLGD